MSRFNFDIHTEAKFQFGAKNKCSTRDLLRAAAERPRWRAVAPHDASNGAGSNRRALPRKQPAQPAPCLELGPVDRNRGLAGGNRYEYRNFIISTVRPAPSTWVAYFTRSDGRPVHWDGKARSIVRTVSYGAEVIAVADAELSIDDLIASGLSSIVTA